MKIQIQSNIHRQGQKKTVQPVKQTAMSGQELARIFHSGPAFQAGFKEISQLETYINGHTQKNKTPHGSLPPEISDAQGHNQTQSATTKTAGPGFFGADTGPDFSVPPQPSAIIRAGIRGENTGQENIYFQGSQPPKQMQGTGDVQKTDKRNKKKNQIGVVRGAGVTGQKIQGQSPEQKQKKIKKTGQAPGQREQKAERASCQKHPAQTLIGIGCRKQAQKFM